jgi:DNA-binding MarR family transcriptional regulator
LALAPLELSPGHYRLLAQLSQGTEASTALAHKLAVSPPSVTTMVDGLVARGAIERSSSAGDRRRVNLALTQLGWELLAAADDASSARLNAIVETLNDPAAARAALDALELWTRPLDTFRAQQIAARTQVGEGR